MTFKLHLVAFLSPSNAGRGGNRLRAERRIVQTRDVTTARKEWLVGTCALAGAGNNMSVVYTDVTFLIKPRNSFKRRWK